MARNIVSTKTGKVGKNVGFSGTHRTSPEKNYFSHFAMRYPVDLFVVAVCSL